MGKAMNSRVSYAVAAILGTTSFSVAAAAAAADSTEPVANAEDEGLTEIIVTAQHRSESMQDVPISMQAFTAETLQQLNISTFDDYIKDLPNVTAAANGPGQNEVFMRGLSAGSQASQGSASTGLWPNVAIYLDNQSGQLPNRNLDIYAADINRIEVLEGPQGTLFGAGAEAGVIRYITNEPKLDVTEGDIKAGYGVTAHGDPNTDLTAVLNLPLISGTMAVRAVIYDDRRGGYINNVPATFTRHDTDIGIHYAHYTANAAGQCPDGGVNTGSCVPPGSPVINNYNDTGKAINPVNYQGIRLEGLYKFNDNWDLLLSQTYQNMASQGVFYQQPNASDGASLQPLEVTVFNPAYDNDRFENSAWTVNGKFGDLKFVYTGGYLVRNVDQVGDYTNYARGVYADYYQCYGATATTPATCLSPSSTWHEVERNAHQQHEMRLSTPDDWRLRAIAGAFWEDNKLWDQTGWLYKTVPTCTSSVVGSPGDTNCFTDVGTFPGTTVENPGVQGDSTSFYQDTVRDTKQTAFFASMDFDLVPKVLTLTVGTRHFEFNNYSAGSVLASFDCFEQGAPAGGCHGAASYNLNADNLRNTESGFKSRGNLTWHITPDAMVYYTYSQGFRPGGFNQNGYSEHATGPDGQWQYSIPASYLSDQLTNNEFGWKTEFFEHRLQWNGAVYQENWNNVQISLFDPTVVGNIFYDTNGQNFRVRGLETSIVARVAKGLTLQAAAAWNQSVQTNSPALIDDNPASVNFGKAINCIGATVPTCAEPVVNPFGAIGSPSADAPPLQYSGRIRYEWVVGGYTPFAQFNATHQGISFTQAGSNPTVAIGGAIMSSRSRFENPAYSTFDAAIGVAKDAWILTLNAENLSNSNASTFISADQFIIAQTPLRPRVIGLSFDYKF